MKAPEEDIQELKHIYAPKKNPNIRAGIVMSWNELHISRAVAPEKIDIPRI